MNNKILSIALIALTTCVVSCKPKFKKLSSNLDLMIVEKGNGKRTAKVNDIFTMNMVVKINDSTVFKSPGNAAKEKCKQPEFKGDPMEGILALHEGDSAIIRVFIDSANMNRMPGTKPGDTLSFEIRLLTLQTEKEYKDKLDKDMKEQVAKNDKTIQDYLKKNNITAQKTSSGLYYVINKPGSGPNAAAGQEVSINYTGRLVDGTTFDSNIDPKFQHVEPIKVVLGQQRVIPGWEEGLTFLNKGAKATLFVPSALAYGPQELPGNPNNPKGIPAFSVLVFDVEVLGMETAKPEAKQPQMEMPH